MLEMEARVSQNGLLPEGSMRRSRHSKSERNSRDVKEKVRIVVGDLETVVTELRAIVVDLRVLVHQIDMVTAKLDHRFGEDWRALEQKSVNEVEKPVSDITVKNSSPTQTEGYIQCNCNRFQFHRVLYMPTAMSGQDKMSNYANGYCLETDIVGKNNFKSKLLPCLDYNQNESFDTEYIDTQTSASVGSEYLPPTFTSDDESKTRRKKLDKCISETKPYLQMNGLWDQEHYSGYYEAEMDAKLENYVSFVDSFESSDEEESRDMDSFRIIANLPDATDAQTRYNMVSSWAECAMINLASDNITSDDSETLPEESGKVAFPVQEDKISKSSIGEFNIVSDMVLFQNEVKSEVGQCRSVLVF